MGLIGKRAPEFNAPRDGGGEVSLESLKGSNVVLYFYPRDDTSGCTKEAQDFTGAMAAFENENVVVVGVSKDSVTKHDKFIAKYDLGVILVSDVDGKICESYGTWVEKQMYGKTHMGIERTTFLIDADGIVQREWRKVKVPGHVEDVLDAVKAL